MSRSELADVQPPAFFGAVLDRVAGPRHDPAWLTECLVAPGAVAVFGGHDGVLVGSDGSLVRAPAAEYVGVDDAVVLGLERGVPVFAVDLDALVEVERARLTKGDVVLVSLRDAGATLSRPEGGLAAYLSALLNWHRRHRFCANCGAGTGISQAGLARRCPRCGATHFPRTDPVVIMLVEHAGRLLLGRRPGWPPNRYSVLAGFVASGESLDEAVVREVREESGIEVFEPRFVTSQPWPFPSSLMLGFEARSDGGHPVAHDGELEDVAWFSLPAVRDALHEQGELRVPPPISIARYLIDRWVAAQA